MDFTNSCCGPEGSAASAAAAPAAAAPAAPDMASSGATQEAVIEETEELRHGALLFCGTCGTCVTVVTFLLGSPVPQS